MPARKLLPKVHYRRRAYGCATKRRVSEAGHLRQDIVRQQETMHRLSAAPAGCEFPVLWGRQEPTFCRTSPWLRCSLNQARHLLTLHTGTKRYSSKWALKSQVTQLTLNQRVEGSSPSTPTIPTPLIIKDKFQRSEGIIWRSLVLSRSCAFQSLQFSDGARGQTLPLSTGGAHLHHAERLMASTAMISFSLEPSSARAAPARCHRPGGETSLVQPSRAGQWCGRSAVSTMAVLRRDD
jgi:hypothetical protein